MVATAMISTARLMSVLQHLYPPRLKMTVLLGTVGDVPQVAACTSKNLGVTDTDRSFSTLGRR